MLRVRFIAAVAFAVVGIALAGCSSTPSWMPSWLTPTPPPPPVQALQFESVPPGADVRTGDGQTCQTPCSLALPLTAQVANFAMSGFLPQNVPVAVAQSGTPSFMPNPVMVTLQSGAPPPKPKPRKSMKTAAKPKPVAAPPPSQDSAFPSPPQPSPASPYPAPAAPSQFPAPSHSQ
jgi:hypothetical protein